MTWKIRLNEWNCPHRCSAFTIYDGYFDACNINTKAKVERCAKETCPLKVE